MASAAVTYVATKLGGLLIQEAKFLYGVEDDVKWIHAELRRMQCFLKDADSKQKEDERVKNWVAEITNVSYRAEDVIDTFISSQAARRSRRGFSEWVKRCVCIMGELICGLIPRDKVGREIEQIKRKINEISTSRETYGIRDINEGRQEASSSGQSLQDRRRFSAMLEEPEVVGQQKEINTLKEQLINEEPRRCVISIFGMGGSGKTTLTRKVFHDVKNDFDCHAFICLSQQYEMKDVLIYLITCVIRKSREEIKNLKEEELGMMLRDHLKKKKYLVVIDDIWSIEALDMLRLALPDGMNGSRVILTTRIEEVAVSPPIKMRLLDEDEGWELFMKQIFPGKNPLTACPLELDTTGRKILAKCGGLPLAILVLGGLLARKDKTFDTWSKVLKSTPESSKQWREVLALSYWDLPHYLKPCFLYFGLFPEDYQISSKRLIRLWIAEGFIQERDNEITEDIGENYLKELVNRSMIQVASKKSNGSISKCHIHDILRDVAIFEARENNFFTIYNDNSTRPSSTSVRRLSFNRSIAEDATINHSIATLRSVLCFPGCEVHLSNILSTTDKLLRVMYVDSVNSSCNTLPEKVGEFHHLKYLNVQCRTISGLPPSIGNLSNLQTLSVTLLTRDMDTLPNTIWNLEELRHLRAKYCYIRGSPRLSNLRKLQTLCLKADSWIEHGLEMLTNLRKLEIYGSLLSYHKNLSESIYQLLNLQSLKLLDAINIPPFMPFTRHLHLYKMHLEGMIERQPEWPPHLVELTLLHSGLKQDAISVLEELPHLKILRLWPGSYASEEMICSSRGFPQLESLHLSQLRLKDWIVEKGALLSLKSVELFYMSNLKTHTLPERVRVLLKRHC